MVLDAIRLLCQSNPDAAIIGNITGPISTASSLIDANVFYRELRKEKEAGRVVRTMLFPPADEIESRYTFLENRHWLLPLAWSVRLFSNLSLIPNRLRQMKQVTRTDKTSVERYDGFMRRIGL